MDRRATSSPRPDWTNTGPFSLRLGALQAWMLSRSRHAEPTALSFPRWSRAEGSAGRPAAGPRDWTQVEGTRGAGICAPGWAQGVLLLWEQEVPPSTRTAGPGSVEQLKGLNHRRTFLVSKVKALRSCCDVHVTCISELKLGVVCTLKMISGFCMITKQGAKSKQPKFRAAPGMCFYNQWESRAFSMNDSATEDGR